MNSTSLVLLLLAPIALAGCMARSKSSAKFSAPEPIQYSIVTSASASPSEQRGANELQSHLSQLTGQSIPILSESDPLPAHAILVGYSKHTDALHITRDDSLGNEGFILKSTGPHLVVAGSPVRGTMYGCYALLDALGIHFLTPSITQMPPVHSNFVLPTFNERQTPAFEYREPYFTEAFDKDFASRNLINGNFMHLDASTGGKVKYSKHFVHTFDALVPTSLYDAHPEYFPLIKGARKKGYVQRCLSNAEVLKMSVDAVNKWMDEEPDATIFSVSQNDCGDWCQCDACNLIVKQFGGNQSGIYLWFVNHIARAVVKKHPDKLVDTLAYQFTEAAPTGIKPEPNVRIRLCPIACCEAHPYEDCSNDNNKKFVKRLKDWASLTDTLYIWHYNTDFAHYLMPFPDFAQFPSSARMYKRLGVKGIFFQGDYHPGGGGSDAELRSYVMAKVLWNLDSDTDALVTQWLNGVYGEDAAKPMRQYFDLIHEPFKNPATHLGIYDPPKKEIFTPELLKQANDLHDQAESLATTDTQKTYVKKSRLGLRYIDLVQNPKTDKTLDNFLADVRSFKIQNISEGKGVDAWENDYRKAHAAKAK